MGGRSYSGALAAWFRIRYPDLVCGAIASSAVVNPIVVFPQFDAQVTVSVGDECATLLRGSMERLVKAMGGRHTNRTALKADLGAAVLTDDGDFWYFISDFLALDVQYGGQRALCAFFADSAANGTDPLATLVRYRRIRTLDARDYATAIDGAPRSARLWWYQTCTQLGYFQVAPPFGSLRPAAVDLRYHLRHCQAVFGVPLDPRDAAAQLIRDFGGPRPNGTNILFTNGSQDPWRHASVTTPVLGRPSITVLTVACEDCGHCVDLGSGDGRADGGVGVALAHDLAVTLVGRWLTT
jgi:pimeloyl-ACP methyl ester carboxylesterase